MPEHRAPVAGAADFGVPGARAPRRSVEDLRPHPSFVRPSRAAARRATAIACGAAALALLAAPSGAAAADGCSNAAIRAAQGATDLPDCRAYEWVSSDNPGGNLAGVDVALRAVAGYTRDDGNRLLFFGTAPYGAADRGPVQTYHFAERTQTGWTARPAIAPTSPDAMTDALTGTQANILPSADLSSYGFGIGRTLGPPNPVTGSSSLYVSSGIGTERWISHTSPGIAPMQMSGTVVGGTPDLSTAYFLSDRRLTAQGGDDVRRHYGLYEHRDGTVRPAGVLPDGTVPPNGVFLGGFGPDAGSTRAYAQGVDMMVRRRNQVSDDGRRLFFVAEVGGARQLYVREDGARTRLLSHAFAAPDTPSAGGVVTFGGTGTVVSAGYAFATPDGSRVLFRSRDVLAAGAESAPADAVKTYRADVATGALRYLPDVNGAPIALDEQASRVVFVDEHLSGTTKHRSLALWDEATGLTHVIDRSRPTVTFEIAWIEATADASTWTLQSRLPLDPIFPDTGGHAQVYRWTIGGGAPTCISCSSGAVYTGNANLTSFSSASTESAASASGSPAFRMQVAPRMVSSDGRRVFFDTPTALVDADGNGVRDVYMWEEGRGVALLSRGTSRDPSFFLDASANGDDVVIATGAALDPADRDQSYDIYNVRVGGGFAVAPPQDCAGDACQPPARGWIAPSPPLSDQVRPVERGADDLARPPARVIVHRVRRDRTGATLRITTSTAGTLRIGGRRVRSLRRSTRSRRAIVVRVRLTRPARRVLARRGRLRTTVSVRFVPSSGEAVTATVKTTIKRKR